MQQFTKEISKCSQNLQQNHHTQTPRGSNCRTFWPKHFGTLSSKQAWYDKLLVAALTTITFLFFYFILLFKKSYISHHIRLPFAVLHTATLLLRPASPAPVFATCDEEEEEEEEEGEEEKKKIYVFFTFY